MNKLLIAANENNVYYPIKDSALSAGFDVTELNDGMKTVHMCVSSDFDMVIMDTALPGLDGFSACREIRKSKNMPIIFISSSQSERDKILAFEVGADDFMVKPISIKLLMARVNAIICRQRAKIPLN